SLGIPSRHSSDFNVLVNDRLIIAAAGQLDVSGQATSAGAQTHQAFFYHSALLLLEHTALPDRPPRGIPCINHLILTDELFGNLLLLQSRLQFRVKIVAKFGRKLDPFSVWEMFDLDGFELWLIFGSCKARQ